MDRIKSYAVISDVHGNYKALEAFLEYCNLHAVDGIICLGDYVTDSPYPERTIALLKQMREQYECYMIRGNRENISLVVIVTCKRYINQMEKCI